MIALAAAETPRMSEWLTESLPAALPGWLPSQRWFAAKSRAIAGARIADIVWLGRPAPRTALLIIDVDYDAEGARAAATERYALLAGFDTGAEPNQLAELPWPPPLRVVEAGAEPDAIVDVLAAITSGSATAGLRGGTLQSADVSTAVLPVARHGEGGVTIKPVGVEQSNTSVRVGRSHVLKVIRRLQPGEHPQLEIERFLTSAGFQGAPRLDGSLTYLSPDGKPHAVAALEGWVENQGDGWSFVIGALERAAGAGPDGADLSRELFNLGAVTAEFHATLAGGASPAFVPEPASPQDVSHWRQRVITQGERLFAVLDAARRGWNGKTAALAGRLLDKRSQLARVVGSFDLDGHVAAVRKIRVHGDYHLGQTLKTASGFVLIDFEGEPSRSIDERRAKDCALKDVAGMLRSLDYAGATCAARGADVSAVIEPMRQAFLDGYFSDARTGAFLPSRPHAAPLLALLELEKALYEVDYELNNRPAWVAIPLAATLRLLEIAP